MTGPRDNLADLSASDDISCSRSHSRLNRICSMSGCNNNAWHGPVRRSKCCGSGGLLARVKLVGFALRPRHLPAAETPAPHPSQGPFARAPTDELAPVQHAPLSTHRYQCECGAGHPICATAATFHARARDANDGAGGDRGKCVRRFAAAVSSPGANSPRWASCWRFPASRSKATRRSPSSPSSTPMGRMT